MIRVRVAPLPPWIDRARLLGPGAWTAEGDASSAVLAVAEAADLAARLRGLGLGGHAIAVEAQPPLPRAAVRAARTEDARRRRDTSPGFTHPRVRLDEEGRFSLTPEALALAVARGTSGRTVLDACCGAGGNTIGFARAGARVIAVERDAGRLALARHNVAAYGLADRVRFLHGDVRTLFRTVQADVVFIDPPWGVEWDRIRTDLGALPLLAELLPLVRAGFAAVWAKVPPSFDPSIWPEATVEAVFGVATGDRRRVKFLVLREDTAGTGR